MQILENITIVRRKKRRLGQGHGSGRGKTAGRGTKGQKARGDIPIRFEGGALPLIKRLPFLRGKDKNNVFKTKPFILDVALLNTLPKNTQVTVDLLIEKKLLPPEAKKDGVKILGNGDVTQQLTIQVPLSKGALIKIEKAGGTVQKA